MPYYCLSFNHKKCPVDFLEKIYLPPGQVRDLLKETASVPDADELLILSTCNRLEFYGFNENGRLPDQALYSILASKCPVSCDELKLSGDWFAGRPAVLHLFRVAAGLESLVIGENEILGQLREAFRFAASEGRVHSMLYRLAERALKTGKDVRSHTSINRGAVSIPSVGVELAGKIFGNLKTVRVMVLGTGEMAKLTLACLRNAGADVLYVVSRCAERGEELASGFGARWVPWEDLTDKLQAVDMVVASTQAPHPVIRAAELKKVMELRKHRPLCLVDIAMPRNIDPAADAVEDVYLYNIDDLKEIGAANLRLRCGQLSAAESLIEEAVGEFSGWLERLSARPVFERYEKFLDTVLDEELGRLAGPGLTDRDKIAEIQKRVRGKLLHPPLRKIKEASRNGGMTRYLEALEALFDLSAGRGKGGDAGEKTGI